jgi:hypothetical protein
VRPRWSPDGRRIVFQNKGEHQVRHARRGAATQRLLWVTNDFFRDLSRSGRRRGATSISPRIQRRLTSGASRHLGRKAAEFRSSSTGAGRDLEPSFPPTARGSLSRSDAGTPISGPSVDPAPDALCRSRRGDRRQPPGGRGAGLGRTRDRVQPTAAAT